MEKILLAINALQVDAHTLDFACYIANLTRSKLTGVFLEQQEEEDVPMLKRLYGMPYVETIVAADLPDHATRKKCSEENIRLFSDACTNRGARCEVVRSTKKHPARKIIEESRFVDLVIVHAETSFEKEYEGTPTHFVKELLAKAECPVLIAPLSFDGIDEIIFTYDGSRSSVFAIKQFTYLFPELSDKKAIVLQVNEEEDMPVTEKDKIAELLKMHYSSIGFQVLKGKPSLELFGHLLAKKNTFVVMGAYGRGMLSGLFKDSTAGLVIKTINCPFFIAHH